MIILYHRIQSFTLLIIAVSPVYYMVCAKLEHGDVNNVYAKILDRNQYFSFFENFISIYTTSKYGFAWAFHVIY